MSYTRQTRLEDSFEEMHGIKPEVYYYKENRDKYYVKLIYMGKEVILSEEMNRGITKKASLEYGGATKNYNKYFDAEMAAARILKE